ncbi:hypothetical protein ABK040_015785, partial [Willaertia magna]
MSPLPIISLKKKFNSGGRGYLFDPVWTALTLVLILLITIDFTQLVNGLGFVDKRSIFAVGTYYKGEMGIDVTKTPLIPYPLDYSFPFKIQEIYIGQSHTAFLTTGGEIYSIGVDDGKFANGTINGYPTSIIPYRCNLNRNITKVAVGTCHMHMLTSTGEVYGTGCLSGNIIAVNINPTLVVDTSYEIIDIQSGLEFTAMLSKDGKVYVIGQNTDGQYGNASLPVPKPVLVNFGVMKDKVITRIRTGQRCIVAETSAKEFIFFGTLSELLEKSEPIVIDAISGRDIADFQVVSYGLVVLLPDGLIYDIRYYIGSSFVFSFSQAGFDGKILTETKILKTNNALYSTYGDGIYNSLSLRNVKVGTKIEKVFTGLRAGSNLAYYLANDGAVYFSVTEGREIALGSAGSSFGLYPFNVTSFYTAFNPSLMKMIKPSKGGLYSIFFGSDNTMYSTGTTDGDGELGGGSLLSSTMTPQKIYSDLLKDKVIVDVSVGLTHTLILTDDGLVYAFGRNSYSQFCGGNPGYYQILQQIPISNVTTISSAEDLSLFVIDNGDTMGKRVYACGKSHYGESGLGQTSHVKGYVNFFDGKNVSSIVTPGLFSLFLTGNGLVYGVGYNYFQSMGVGTNQGPFLTPVQILLPEKIIKIGASWNNTLFLTESGEVYFSGQMGRSVVGLGFAFLLTSEGEVYGARFMIDGEYLGQIGAGLNPTAGFATEIPLGYKVKSIEAGLSHTFFVMEPSCDL